VDGGRITSSVRNRDLEWPIAAAFAGFIDLYSADLDRREGYVREDA
jgi:hypothetical protein